MLGYAFVVAVPTMPVERRWLPLRLFGAVGGRSWGSDSLTPTVACIVHLRRVSRVPLCRRTRPACCLASSGRAGEWRWSSKRGDGEKTTQLRIPNDEQHCPRAAVFTTGPGAAAHGCALVWMMTRWPDDQRLPGHGPWHWHTINLMLNISSAEHTLV